MTNTELLALADALCFNGRYGYETQERSAERRIEERAQAAAILRKLAELEPVAWQWRKLDSHWSLDRTFNSEVFVTTVDSERRALYQLSEVLTDE